MSTMMMHPLCRPSFACHDISTNSSTTTSGCRKRKRRRCCHSKSVNPKCSVHCSPRSPSPRRWPGGPRAWPGETRDRPKTFDDTPGLWYESGSCASIPQVYVTRNDSYHNPSCQCKECENMMFCPCRDARLRKRFTGIEFMQQWI